MGSKTVRLLMVVPMMFGVAVMAVAPLYCVTRQRTAEERTIRSDPRPLCDHTNIAEIGSNLPACRIAAWRYWRNHPMDAAVGPLVSMTEHPDALLRAMAAELLGEIGSEDPHVMYALLRLTMDPNPSVAARAAWSLGACGSAEAVKSLVRPYGPTSITAIGLQRVAESRRRELAETNASREVVPSKPLSTAWTTCNGVAMRATIDKDECRQNTRVEITIELLNVRCNPVAVPMPWRLAAATITVLDHNGVELPKSYRLPGYPRPLDAADRPMLQPGGLVAIQRAVEYSVTGEARLDFGDYYVRVNPGGAYQLQVQITKDLNYSEIPEGCSADIVDDIGWFGELISEPISIELR